MSQTIKLNEHIYYLLIEKNLNHFTVTSLRDELLACNNIFWDPFEARVLVYKQICGLVKKNLLVRDANPSPTKAIYSKSLTFKYTHFIKKTRAVQTNSMESKFNKINRYNQFKFDIQTLQNEYETESRVVESELEEYQRLMKQYPQISNSILEFVNEGNMRMLLLKGKLAALKRMQEM